MTAKIEIRPFCSADQAVWHKLWTGYLKFYKTSLPEAVYQSTWQKLMTEDYFAPRGFLAWNGDTAIGLVHYFFHASCWKIENVCYLQDLYVSRSARGLGAGRALIEAVYVAADAENTPSVYWMTQDHNSEARKLYDRIAVKTDFIKYQR